MKLYNVPHNSTVVLLQSERGPPASREVKVGERVTFKHLDGMYSYCLDKDNNVVHLPGWAEVGVVL